MIDFKEISKDGEEWELFARDFLSALGFIIDTPPDRGSDGGRDMIVSENIKGLLNNYQFKWLVSCKHFAHGKRSVNESDHEKNILERIESFKADGFIGFYSTLASSGLNQRLTQLKYNGSIKDYQIFDHKLIESYLFGFGFSQIMIRYLPESYKNLRPLNKIIDEYVPIECDHCGKDLLKSLYSEEYKGVIAWVRNENDEYFDMYFACKGKCDEILEKKYFSQYKAITSWKDLSDLVMPNEFLRWIITSMNTLHSKSVRFTDKVLNKERHLIIALSQKIFREVNKRERERLFDLININL